MHDESLKRWVEFVNSGKRPYSGYRVCESPAEEALLTCLDKFYGPGTIEQQVEVDGGRYRMDFVTNDRVGWEVDGKDFHDWKRDRERDQWILAHTDLELVVRIEAAALRYYRDATLAGLSHFVGRLERARSYCQFDFRVTRNEADRWLEGIEEGRHSVADMLTSFEQVEAYDVYLPSSGRSREGGATVGGPFAFLTEHPLWHHIPPDRRELNRWLGGFVVRYPDSP